MVDGSKSWVTKFENKTHGLAFDPEICLIRALLHEKIPSNTFYTAKINYKQRKPIVKKNSVSLTNAIFY